MRVAVSSAKGNGGARENEEQSREWMAGNAKSPVGTGI